MRSLVIPGRTVKCCIRTTHSIPEGRAGLTEKGTVSAKIRRLYGTLFRGLNKKIGGMKKGEIGKIQYSQRKMI
jgi:hypothetical protein